VPATELTLTTDKGDVDRVAVGEQITVVGTGFLPYSTATIVIYSTPTVLGTVTTDGNGNFSRAVTVPRGLAAGQHNLVASGVAPDGSQRFMKMAVTVGTTKAAQRLASTGASVTGPVVGGLVAIAAGTGLLFAVRRRVES
jgi:LPXTG-motif cell wall-anchored protein